MLENTHRENAHTLHVFSTLYKMNECIHSPILLYPCLLLCWTITAAETVSFSFYSCFPHGGRMNTGRWSGYLHGGTNGVRGEPGSRSRTPTRPFFPPHSQQGDHDETKQFRFLDKHCLNDGQKTAAVTRAKKKFCTYSFWDIRRRKVATMPTKRKRTLLRQFMYR